MNRLNKSKDALETLVEKDWMNYSLELPSVLYMYMRTLPAMPMRAELFETSEILEGLQAPNLSDFKISPLLHVEGNLRIQNDISLIVYKNQPFMVIQTVNGGVTGERLLNEGAYIEIGALHPPKPGSFIIPDRIRYFMGDTFTVNASSDHILVFDGIALYSSATDDFPNINE